MNVNEMMPYWQAVRRGLLEALDEFSDEELYFRPAEGLWSLGEVALHIADAEEGWFDYVVQRRFSEWPPNSSLQAYPSMTGVQKRLDEVHTRTLDFLKPLSPADLDRAIQAPWGSEFPLHFVLWHVLEHEIHHRGEIFLMLGMLGRPAPDV